MIRTRTSQIAKTRTNATLDEVELIIERVASHRDRKDGLGLRSLEDGDDGANGPGDVVIQHVVEGKDPSKDFFKPRHGVKWRG